MNVSALSKERGQHKAAGQVVLPRKTLWRDGITHLVMTPLEFTLQLLPRSRARVGLGRSRDVSRERLLRGEPFRVVTVADGSGAGVRGRQPAGRGTSRTGTSRPDDRYVQVSGLPPRSGERCLTAISRR